MFVAYYLSRERQPYSATTLLQDHTGVIWCGTSTGVYQLAREAGQSVLRFVDMGMSTNYGEAVVQTLLEDRNGALWVGTMAGLYRRLSDGHTGRYRAHDGLPNTDIRALLEDREGHLWAGTRGGLCLLVSEPKPNQAIVARTFAKRDGLAADQVFSLFQSADGHLWVGMFGGLSSFIPDGSGKASQISSFTTANGLTYVAVWAIAEDREGNLWLASNGALKLAREGFTTYHEDDGLGSNQIASVFANQKGEVCTISSDITKKYINQFDGRKFTAVLPNLSNRIRYIGSGWNQTTFQDHTGEWWVATGDGLVRFPKVGRLEQLAHTLPKDVYHALGDSPVEEVFRLYEDSRGDIWISAYSGTRHWISRWERATETFHNYAPADGLPLVENWLPLTTAFREDRAGNLWIGFNGFGLARFNQGRFTVFTTDDGLPAGWIRDLFVDHAGRLWIASSREGVSRIDDTAAEHPRFINYRADSGLASDNVWCITEDESHRIYVGTGRGVDRLEPENSHIRHYTQADGLAQNEVQDAFRDAHGSLWFGTPQGLSRLDPQADQAPRSLPILISGLRINGIVRHISELGETKISKLVLTPYENQVQIDFVGLEFGAGQSLRYQYKLEGSDADWRAPTGARSVNFASLSSGDYRFSVRAISADGVMSTAPATVSFTILPPIWRRWWFVTLAVMALGLGVYGGHRYRVARLVELARVRARIATDLHDEIGSNLSLMAIVSDLANKQAEPGDSQMSEWLSLIAGTSRETMDAMSDIVWVINPDKDRLRDLTLRMRRVADDIFTARNITFQFSAPGEEVDVELYADTRHEVFMIFKESVNNIVRHSECTQADIEFKVEQGRLVLRVSDNGRGFEPASASASEGNGLSNMRRRAKNLGGELEVISSAGNGTTVILRAPLNG
jgi:ligand-binding sensor domain-containing protein/two-component sensor histidine kinase